jgi:hypothetical protein
MDPKEIGSEGVEWMHLVRVGTNSGSFHKSREFLHYLNEYSLLKKDSAPWSWLVSISVWYVG